MNPHGDALTWTCDVCGARRPDDKISVHTTTLTTKRGIKMKQNVRYCNDRRACIEGAPSISFMRRA